MTTMMDRSLISFPLFLFVTFSRPHGSEKLNKTGCLKFQKMILIIKLVVMLNEYRNLHRSWGQLDDGDQLIMINYHISAFRIIRLYCIFSLNNQCYIFAHFLYNIQTYVAAFYPIHFAFNISKLFG